MWFSSATLGLTVAQAGCIALAAAGLPRWADRFRGPAWALMLPLSIAAVVVAIAAIPSTADVLTWVAVLLVPIGGALAFGWAMRGARPWLAALAPPLLALAWALPDRRLGQLAAVVLIAGSAITRTQHENTGGRPWARLCLGEASLAVLRNEDRRGPKACAPRRHGGPGSRCGLLPRPPPR